MPQARRSIWKKLAILAVSTLVALLTAELAHRAFLAIKGNPYDSGKVAARMQAMLDPLKNFVPPSEEQPDKMSDGKPYPILHPYTGAEADHDTGNVLRYFREHPDSEEYEIVLVGGSVAAFFAMTESSELARMVEAVPRLAGRKVRVLNYGHGSYKQPQQVNRVLYLLALGARPEAVINIDGFNELALAMENAHDGTNPIHPSAPTWAVSATNYAKSGGNRLANLARMLVLRDEARGVIQRALRFGYTRSSLLGTWTLGRLGQINVERNTVQREMSAAPPPEDPRHARQVHGPDYPVAEDARFRMCVDAWAEGSISLDAICRARGIEYLHVLQPALGDAGSKKKISVAEAAIVPPSQDWIDGPRIGYPLLRERGEELTARGIAFLDATGAFEEVKVDLYTDPCHFLPQGNRILLGRIGPAFCKLLGAE